MRTVSIYVETSVWSHAFAEDAPESKEATLAFFDRARSEAFELFVSEVVLAEVSRASERRAAQIQQLILDAGPVVLDFDEETDRLAQQFLGLGAVPPAKTEDAQHVAIATVGELDVLVSWMSGGA